MVKGKRVISENVRMMVLLQDIWHQKGHQDALVILVINLYKQIQNKLLQKILELKSRNEENKNATMVGFLQLMQRMFFVSYFRPFIIILS